MDLNAEQRAAVYADTGPILVIAPPGSGKTRTIAARARHLGGRLLVVTFTNKAAAEMKERIGPIPMWCGTFHSVCVRMLRACGGAEGRTRSFSIYDRKDAEGIAKACLAEIESDLTPDDLVSWISLNKNKGLSWEDVDAHRALWRRYESKLLESNAFDFDDLLLVTLRATETAIVGPFLRWKQTFDAVLVDEYQDTNAVQVRLLKQWAPHHNIFAVGDSRQAIYGFRGADYANMTSFSTQFPGATIVELRENYRSGRGVINYCNTIATSHGWRESQMSCNRDEEGDVSVKGFVFSEEEADHVVAKIKAHVDGGAAPGECAVLYRLHALSRPIEERLVWSQIRYRIVGGLRFYERAVVRDTLAYLRFAVNPSSAGDLARLCKTPRRGLGDKAIDDIIRTARQHGCTLLEAMTKAGLSATGRRSCRELTKLFLEARGRPTLEQARCLIGGSGLLDHWRGMKEKAKNAKEEDKATMALEHIQDVVSAVAAYENRHESPTLEGYLNEVALLSDQDDVTDDVVQLMTIHASKGLEFDRVFVVGLEEEILPCTGAIRSGDVSEELRLFYVACSRAKRFLHVTHCKHRMFYGKYREVSPSRFFLKEPPHGRVNDGSDREHCIGGSVGAGSSLAPSLHLPVHAAQEDA